MRAFDDATAVTPIGEGLYAASIDAGWDIAGNANGGYLLAVAVRAIADAVGRPPLSVTAHYLAPGRTGDCQVAVEVLRAGKRTATAIARVRSDGQDVVAVLGTFGEQTPGGPSLVAAEPPALPPFEQCVRTAPPASGDTGFGDRVHNRIDPDDAGFMTGSPSGRAEVSGWFTFSDAAPADQVIDAIALMQVADSFVPVCFNHPGLPVSWAPTLELTVHIRAIPVRGPIRCRFRSRFIQDGLFEEDGEMWDAGGTLVAQSRQLALLPRS